MPVISETLGLFSTMFTLIFVLVIGVFIMVFIKTLRQSIRTRRAPRLKVEALVVSKRSHVSRHHDAHSPGRPLTRYYACFQVESGDRMELAMDGGDFGLLLEGDFGMLEFQGDRFISFERR